MSPEQIDGARVDGRSDLYSLGLVAWEMLTGRRPWDGESLYSVIYRQKHHELIAIEELRPDVSERLRYLIDGLLRKQPASRWSSAERFLGRLNDASDPPGLKQWRQHKRKLAKQRREPPRPAPNEPSLPEAPTEHFRRSGSQQAVSDQKLDARSTPQTIRVETSTVTPDEWSVEDDGTSRPRRRYARWVAAGVVVVAGAAAAALVYMPREPESASPPLDQPRATFSDAGTIEVPALRPETTTTTATRDSAALPAPAAQRQAENVAATVTTARRDSANPPRATPQATAPQQQPVVPPAAVITPPVIATDTTPVPNEPPVVRLAFPAERGLVAAGARHSCALANGKAQCWGNNENGQLGGGTTDVALAPVTVAGDFSFAQLSAGDAYTCGVTASGEGLCWGNNEAGQLGDGTATQRTAPVGVSGGHTFKLIRSGRLHACGLTRAGDVVCWGSNAFGQLGDGTKSTRTRPVRVSLPGSAEQLAAGGSHSCALLIDGSAFCWGNNANGQLGDSSRTAHGEPTRVATAQRFVSIAAGRNHTCAVTPDNAAYCWGANSAGQAGIGSVSESVMAPQRVETQAALRTIAAGLNHTCALTNGGTAYCWGANNSGQLGDGTKNRHSRPVTVQGAGALVALFPGASHTCGRNGGGEVFCWGFNIDGQLGSGGREDSNVPIKVPDPSR
jgi:alpha-tubulin suppressor-like RCC1 family protein